MRFPNLLFTLLVVLARFCQSTPETEAKVESINERAMPVLGLLREVVEAFTLDFIKTIYNIINQEDKECRFIDELTTKLAIQFEKYNVLVYEGAEADSPFLNRKECYEATVSELFGEKVYSVCLFQDGQYVRNQDLGCRNWGWKGCWSRANKSNKVEFEARESCPYQTEPGGPSEGVEPTASPHPPGPPEQPNTSGDPPPTLSAATTAPPAPSDNPNAGHEQADTVEGGAPMTGVPMVLSTAGLVIALWFGMV